MTKKVILERKDKVTSARWRASGSQCLSTTETAKATDRPLQTDANSSRKGLDYREEVGKPCRWGGRGAGGRVVSHGAGTGTEHLAPSSAGSVVTGPFWCRAAGQDAAFLQEDCSLRPDLGSSWVNGLRQGPYLSSQGTNLPRARPQLNLGSTGAGLMAVVSKLSSGRVVQRCPHACCGSHRHSVFHT